MLYFQSAPDKQFLHPIFPKVDIGYEINTCMYQNVKITIPYISTYMYAVSACFRITWMQTTFVMPMLYTQPYITSQ